MNPNDMLKTYMELIKGSNSLYDWTKDVKAYGDNGDEISFQDMFEKLAKKHWKDCDKSIRNFEGCEECERDDATAREISEEVVEECKTLLAECLDNVGYEACFEVGVVYIVKDVAGEIVIVEDMNGEQVKVLASRFKIYERIETVLKVKGV